MTNPMLEPVAREIRKHSSFLLSGHVHPEGDCAGSLLGMERLLRRLGKQTKIYCDSPFPRSLAFLDRGSWETAGEQPLLFKADAAVALDTPNWERFGRTAPYLKALPVINIDHHISNSRFGAVNYVDPEASACGEIIFDLYEYFKMPLQLEDARILYTAISTDTGSFRYSNTTPKTHEIAARLFAAGLEVERINQEIYGNYPEARLDLTQAMLKRRRAAFEGRLAYSILPHAVLRKTGGLPEDLEGAIDLIRCLKGVKACFIATEWIKGVVKFSFRSSSEVDVNQIASALGGGGHKKASGASCTMSVKQAERAVLELFKVVLT